MNIKQFKKKLIYSITQPELFLLPISGESYDSPLIYKVKQKEVYLSISNQYSSFELLDEDVIIDGENLGKRKLRMISSIDLLKGYIDWGDGTITDFLYDDLSQKQDVKINHSYSDLELEHNISVYGTIPMIELYGFPIEIVQWGNIHLKQLFNFISPDSNCSDCADEFKIPNTPLTGMGDLVYLYCLFNNCAIEKIPDNFFCNCRSLVYAYRCFDHCNNLKELGDNLFKDLTSLTFIYSIANSCSKLEIVGNSLFENCISLDAYYDNYAGGRLMMGGNNIPDQNLGINYNIFIPFDDCPISKIGNNMYKNCTGLHSLLSKYYFDSSRGEAIEMFSYITDSSNKILHLGESTFEGCINLKYIGYMFYHSTVSNLPKTTFKGCKNVISSYGMFGSCPFGLNLEEGIFDDMTQLRITPYMYHYNFVSCLPSIPSKKSDICEAIYQINTNAESRRKIFPSYYLYSTNEAEKDENNKLSKIITYYKVGKVIIKLADGTTLPSLNWNERYLTALGGTYQSQIWDEDRSMQNKGQVIYTCKDTNISRSNWKEYFQKWAISEVDMTKMFDKGIYDNAIASFCFYGVSGGGSAPWMLNGGEGCLYSWDIYNYMEDYNDPYSKQDIQYYQYVTVTGTMPHIWEHTDGGTDRGLNSFAYHQIGISNFNDIPQDDRNMVGYSNIYEGAPDWLKAMNNEELTRYLGRVRRISEFPGLKEFKKEDFYQDGKHTGRTISQI